MHVAAPATAAADPAGQGTQEVALLCSPRLPHGQGRQSLSLVAPARGWYVPAGHHVQLPRPSAPSRSLYVPAAQARQRRLGAVSLLSRPQMLALSTMATKPSGHGAHAADDVALVAL